METLVPDEVAALISREINSSSFVGPGGSGSLLLARSVSSADVAFHLTWRDFEIFRSIEPSEYVNDLFELSPLSSPSSPSFASSSTSSPSSSSLARFSEVELFYYFSFSSNKFAFEIQADAFS